MLHEGRRGGREDTFITEIVRINILLQDKKVTRYDF